MFFALARQFFYPIVGAVDSMPITTWIIWTLMSNCIVLGRLAQWLARLVYTE